MNQYYKQGKKREFCEPLLTLTKLATKTLRKFGN
jgi:hypothetical protein